MNAQDMPIGSTTTTEELIVQYLDGELIRRELETVLFERLAKNEEARQLLREHLVIRGAIRDSFDDERFQLSSDLDAKTRSRIEEVLKALPQPTTGAPDASPARIDPTKRRLERWAVRPAYAALLLVFAVAATWFVTRTAEKPASQVAMTSPAEQPAASSQQQASTTVNSVATDAAPKVIVKEKIVEKPVVRYVSMQRTHRADLADNAQTSSAPAVTAKEQPSTDPSDIMISRRFGKLLKETAKQEVVVTSHDRL
jgi:negative regulator of sigma E activity